MMLRLLPLQAALLGPHEDAQRFRADRFFREADLIDETLVRAFFALSGELTEDFGWVRAFRALLDINAPLAVDGLAREDFSQVAVRLTAILALPPLETLETAEQVLTTIANAIHVGAPTYNGGNARGCGIIYWATSLTLIAAPTARGFGGQARAIKVLKQVVDEPLPVGGSSTRTIDDFAWRMRHALDAVLEQLGS